MRQEKQDAFKGIIESIDKTEKEIIHLLLSFQEGFKKGKITKKFYEHKKEFYQDFLVRFDAMKELVRYPRKPNLRLKRLREEKGWSQEQVAKKVGISRAWYIYLEAGEVFKVSRRVKERVCLILEVSYKEAFPIDHLLEMLIKKSTN